MGRDISETTVSRIGQEKGPGANAGASDIRMFLAGYPPTVDEVTTVVPSMLSVVAGIVALPPPVSAT